MAALAAEDGLKSRLRIEIIPGKGHSMGGLIGFAQQALLTEAD